jgi:hypothetical protein
VAEDEAFTGKPRIGKKSRAMMEGQHGKVEDRLRSWGVNAEAHRADKEREELRRLTGRGGPSAGGSQNLSGHHHHHHHHAGAAKAAPAAPAFDTPPVGHNGPRSVGGGTSSTASSHLGPHPPRLTASALASSAGSTATAPSSVAARAPSDIFDPHTISPRSRGAPPLHRDSFGTSGGMGYSLEATPEQAPPQAGSMSFSNGGPSSSAGPRTGSTTNKLKDDWNALVMVSRLDRIRAFLPLLPLLLTHTRVYCCTGDGTHTKS